MKYAIDKGVPIPTSGGPGRPPGEYASKYPFREMVEGDSAFIPFPLKGKRGAHKNASRISSSLGAAKAILRDKGQRPRFVTRTVTEHGVEGVRVWRIADEPLPNGGVTP